MSSVKTFFIKDTSLEFVPAISLKTNSNTEVFAHGFFMVTLFELLKNFLRDIFAKHFLTKSQASNIQVATLQEITCLAKYTELAFNSKGYSYCVKNCIHIRMPMPMPITIPRFPNCHLQNRVDTIQKSHVHHTRNIKHFIERSSVTY